MKTTKAAQRKTSKPKSTKIKAKYKPLPARPKTVREIKEDYEKKKKAAAAAATTLAGKSAKVAPATRACTHVLEELQELRRQLKLARADVLDLEEQVGEAIDQADALRASELAQHLDQVDELPGLLVRARGTDGITFSWPSEQHRPPSMIPCMALVMLGVMKRSFVDVRCDHFRLTLLGVKVADLAMKESWSSKAIFNYIKASTPSLATLCCNRKKGLPMFGDLSIEESSSSPIQPMANHPVAMLEITFLRATMAAVARRNGIHTQREEDLGYWSHLALQQLWGKEAPKPFRVISKNQSKVTVLGYIEATKASRMISSARFNAPPDLFNGVVWDSIHIKPMPASWTEGEVFNFELRAAPIVRAMGGGFRQGAEVYVVDRRRRDGCRDSETKIVSQWLQDQMVQVGASVLSIQHMDLLKEPLVRRDHSQVRRVFDMEIPVVRAVGQLEVLVPDRFNSLLARGVGKYRTFGLGMVRLKSTGCSF